MSVVLAFSSHVSRGFVGNVAVTTILRALGHEVWQVPTIILSNHKGYTHCAGPILPRNSIRDMVTALDRNGWLSQVDAILTGYIAEANQADDVLYALDRVRQHNKHALYWCDPILGDHPGGLYVSDEVAMTIADQLVPLADGLSPNSYELEYLSGIVINDAASAVQASRKLGNPLTMTTSFRIYPASLLRSCPPWHW
jgi:pyridoxine kinase